MKAHFTSYKQISVYCGQNLETLRWIAQKDYISCYDELMQLYNASIIQLTSELEAQMLKPQELVYHLKILTTPIDSQLFQSTYSKGIEQIISQTQKAIKIAIDSLPEQYMQRYVRMVSRNKRLIQISQFRNKRWFNLFTSWRNFVLLEIMSLALHKNHLYQEKCFVQLNIIYYEEIAKLTQMKIEDIAVFNLYQLKVQNYIELSIFKKIDNFLGILTLLKLRHRISSLKRESSQNLIELLVYKQTNTKKRQQAALIKRYQELTHKYLFSEIAIFAKEKENNVFPSFGHTQIIRRFRIIALQQSQELSKTLILLLKMKTKVSLDLIYQFLKCLLINQYNKEAFFAKNTLPNYELFEKKLEYMFIRPISYEKAFKDHNFNSEYNIKYNPIRQPSCQDQIISSIVKVMLKKAQISQEITNMLLQFDKPLISLAKYEFSYNQITKKQGQDKIITFILATTQERIFFYKCHDKKADRQQFALSLKDTIQASKGIQSFNYVAYIQQLDYELSQFKPLAAFLHKKFGKRLYISNLSRHAQLSIAIYLNIKQLVNKIIPKINKQYFQSAVMKIITKKMNALKQISSQYQDLQQTKILLPF